MSLRIRQLTSNPEVWCTATAAQYVHGVNLRILKVQFMAPQVEQQDSGKAAAGAQISHSADSSGSPRWMIS